MPLYRSLDPVCTGNHSSLWPGTGNCPKMDPSPGPYSTRLSGSTLPSTFISKYARPEDRKKPGNLMTPICLRASAHGKAGTVTAVPGSCNVSAVVGADFDWAYIV